MAENLSAIATLAWPLLVLVALLVFWRPLARLLGSADVTVEIGGQKLTIKQLNDQQTTLVADLQREVSRLSRQVAALSGGTDGAPPEDTGPWQGVALGDPAHGGPVVSTTGWTVPQAVLWVDDNPVNNAVLVDRLRHEGVRVDLAVSTAEAMSRLDRAGYAVVVSDMSRVENKQTVPDAGVRLLRLIRSAYPDQRVVIYAGPGQAYGREAREAGAAAVTSSPMDLLRELRAAGLPA